MFCKFCSLAILTLLVSGCASVPMAPADASAKVKAFSPPATGNSGLYIYRSLGIGLGASLKKDIWVDSRCIGESAPDVFFYTEVKGNAEHKLSTESEFSPNDLQLRTESGKHYFIKQYLKPGVFVGGAGLEVVPETEGKAAIAKLDLAKGGVCSK